MKEITFDDCKIIHELHNEGLSDAMIALRFDTDVMHIQNIRETPIEMFD